MFPEGNPDEKVADMSEGEEKKVDVKLDILTSEFTIGKIVI